MNKINQLFAEQRASGRKLLSLYFCAGCPTLEGTADVIKTLKGTFNSANDVKIKVQKRGEWYDIEAHVGEPASKLAVGTDYEWCDERQNINDKYSNFSNYVQENTLTEWWRAEQKTVE